MSLSLEMEFFIFRHEEALFLIHRNFLQNLCCPILDYLECLNNQKIFSENCYFKAQHMTFNEQSGITRNNFAAIYCSKKSTCLQMALLQVMIL